MGRQESRLEVESLLKIMKETLSQGEDLLISGFGKFSVRQKRARLGRNPQTKEGMILAARKVLVFKASRILRKRINEGFESPD
jgi:integration host factor subunit alpha